MITLASISLSFAAVAVVGLLVQQRILSRYLRSQMTMADQLLQAQERIHQLDQQFAALCKASAGAGEHVVQLEHKMLRLIERQNQVEMRASSQRPYSQASQLVHKGANTNDLMETCGLTQGEAELLVMMQRGNA